ncbi:MAG: hypothetical protein M1829_003766 [Trizodia sp. TS-e1964]|nr:MAG: hypothetical protein M1829_003766 [Trizodia sp. TS-e1964]
MAPLSRLEQLPNEIKQDIIVLSTNLDLPRVSRGFMVSLSSFKVKLRITIAMLASDSAELQQDLVSCRFFDLKIFDSAARVLSARNKKPLYLDEMLLQLGLPECKSLSDVPEYVFQYGVTMPRRLLHNYAAKQLSPDAGDNANWKIERMSRLLAGHCWR